MRPTRASELALAATAGGQVGQPAAALQVGDDLLDDGVLLVVGLDVEQLPVPIGDEGVVAEGDVEGQLRAGVGRTRRTTSRTSTASGVPVKAV